MDQRRLFRGAFVEQSQRVAAAALQGAAPGPGGDAQHLGRQHGEHLGSGGLVSFFLTSRGIA